jgi:hypothetical protein
MEIKTCKWCGEDKPYTEEFFRPFAPSEIANGRKGELHPKCRRCITISHNKWTKDRNLHVNEYNRKLRYKKADFIDSLKDVPCKDCGIKYPPYVMDFDHLPEFTKVANIPKLVNKRANHRSLLAEISKCEVVCSNCHRIRTMTRGTGTGRYAKGLPTND